ncbi:thioredoxin-related transmembrane protein 2 homolog [Dermacentor albipictus]|uniref:thioredoxin-related transmembrane protein 2 homolog n=1 Tax=Dermacentor albipictus TaxID=60249 RepID=UPI0038FC7EE7
MALVTGAELRRLLHPHYLVNLLLAACFPVLRLVRPFCDVLFPGGDCQLDFRETEILTFVAVVVLFRTRKTGVVRLLPYLSTACMYAKVAGLLLFFYWDPRLGLVYGALCLLQLLVLPEPPAYGGPDPVLYLDAESFGEQVQRGDRRVCWLVAFYALWSPACVQMAPAFAQLAARYALDNLRFAKLDVTRFPDLAHAHHISTAALSRQLPTVLLFRGGRVVARRPDAQGGKLAPFAFTEDNMAAAFDLNNLHQECRQNPIRKKPAGKQS